MSGSAFVLGIAIGVYEWTAAIALIVVAKWLLPVFLKRRRLYDAAVPGTAL